LTKVDGLVKPGHDGIEQSKSSCVDLIRASMSIRKHWPS
jgi:hypothetical protein